MCDANIQKHQFSNLPTFNIVLKSQHDILQVIVQKLHFINQNT